MRIGTTKQSEKVRYLPRIVGVMVSHYNMVSPQNDDTRGGPPPCPPSDATERSSGVALIIWCAKCLQNKRILAHWSFKTLSVKLMYQRKLTLILGLQNFRKKINRKTNFKMNCQKLPKISISRITSLYLSIRLDWRSFNRARCRMYQVTRNAI